MKKFTIYSLMLASVYCLSLLSADATGTRPQHSKHVPKPKMISFRNPQLPNPQVPPPFFLEDFNSGFPFNWDSLDVDTAGLQWKWTLTGSQSGNMLSTTGTSASNGYMIIDNDSAFGVGLPNAAMVTYGIDCSLHSNVHLKFNEFFQQFDSTMGVVSVSNDSINWTEFHHVEAGLCMGCATTNPLAVDTDISSVAANQLTVYIRFQYSGLLGPGYWWMVDDVVLYENAAADGGVTSIDAPVSNCAGLSATEPVTVTISNFGGADINGGFEVYFSVDGGPVDSEAVSDTVFQSNTLSYTFTATADVSAPGTHTITAWTVIPSDADNTNDTASTTIFTGANVINYASGYTNGFEIGIDNMAGWATVDGNSDGNIWGITNTSVPNTGSYNAMFFGELPNNAADDYLFTPCMDMDTLIPYQLDFWYRGLSTIYQGVLDVGLYSDQTSASQVFNLVPANNDTDLFYQESTSIFLVPTPGIYYIGFHVTNTDSSTAILIDDINMHTVDSLLWLSVHQNASAKTISIYPNPSTGIIHINNSSKSEKDFAMAVTNMMGEVVFFNKFNNLSSEVVDLSKLSPGVYSVEMKSATNSIHQSIVISGK